MGSDRPLMSDAEREVLKVLWDHGPQTVRDVLARLKEQGQEWTRSTVITLLQRLEKKGYVESDKTDFAFLFRARLSREEVLHSRIVELADELVGGEPLPLVLAFAEKHRFTPEDIERFRTMIERLEADRKKRRSR